MLAERVKEWPRQWRKEGRQEGKVILFREMLENRFGILPAWVEKQLETANEEQLRQWSQRIFEAKQLQDIFAPQQEH